MPYAFTEQGIYQLATVLRGDLAVRQSIAIMRGFRAMRQFIYEYRQLLPQQEALQLLNRQNILENEFKIIKEKMVTRTDLSEYMKLFNNGMSEEEVLILDGQPFKADLAYQKIYSKAKRSVIVIDDYIGVKTLLHMVHAPSTVTFTVISDNI